jgi:hypothetical protein
MHKTFLFGQERYHPRARVSSNISGVFGTSSTAAFAASRRGILAENLGQSMFNFWLHSVATRSRNVTRSEDLRK